MMVGGATWQAGAEVGIAVEHHKFERSTTKEELLANIQNLNNDPTVHGIIVQMPLDSDESVPLSQLSASLARPFLCLSLRLQLA
jgi:methylenetetrahydrofolate dehydrogenase (NADP+)/methenyltetrahydrofolate cyclohydrolase/formyltetrahydrofolate synthetase